MPGKVSNKSHLRTDKQVELRGRSAEITNAVIKAGRTDKPSRNYSQTKTTRTNKKSG